MTYTVFAKRKGKREPIFDSKSKELLDDGSNIDITIWKNCPVKDTATRFSENILKSRNEGVWKVWIEKDK